MTKEEEQLAIGAAVLLVLGVALFAGSSAKAATGAEQDEPDEPAPVPKIPAEPSIPTGNVAIKIPISTLFVEGAKCQVDQQRYNAMQWPTPQSVGFAFRALGYPVTDTLAGAINIGKIKDFQRRARQLFLEGMQNAPDSFIDGVVGPCTLRALTEAAIRFNNGQWQA